jgi:hypothetical protein
MNELLKKFGALWSELTYTDKQNISRTKYWLTGAITDEDAHATHAFHGTSVTLFKSQFIVNVRLAGSTYLNKSTGLMQPRKTHSIELRPDTRKYVDLSQA